VRREEEKSGLMKMLIEKLGNGEKITF